MPRDARGTAVLRASREPSRCSEGEDMSVFMDDVRLVAAIVLAAGLGCLAAPAQATPATPAAPAPSTPAAAAPAAVELDSYSFGGLEARAIGPAATGGRIA